MWDYIKTCHTNTIHYLDFSIYSQMESSVLKESFKLNTKPVEIVYWVVCQLTHIATFWENYMPQNTNPASFTLWNSFLNIYELEFLSVLYKYDTWIYN